MTTFKVYFICSAPKAVWALERGIVIYSEVHLIMLCNRKRRRGKKLYVGSIWFKQARKREWTEGRETELIPTHLKPVITSLSAWWMITFFIMNEWRYWKERVNGIGLHIVLKITVIIDLLLLKKNPADFI